VPRGESRSVVAARNGSSRSTDIMSGCGRYARQVGWWTLLDCLMLVGPPSLVHAQTKIEVPEAGGAGLPIAISPLKSLDSEGGGRRLGEEFADIIARDLDLSGLFKVIDRGAY